VPPLPPASSPPFPSTPPPSTATNVAKRSASRNPPPTSPSSYSSAVATVGRAAGLAGKSTGRLTAHRSFQNDPSFQILFPELPPTGSRLFIAIHLKTDFEPSDQSYYAAQSGRKRNLTHDFFSNRTLLSTFPSKHTPNWVVIFGAGFLPLQARVHLTVGNRSGYRGNRSYRSASVRKKLGYRSLTEPNKP
jgi:hypothetical protein